MEKNLEQISIDRGWDVYNEENVSFVYIGRYFMNFIIQKRYCQ